MSLVELLVAIAIIALVVAPFMGTFLEATHNNNFSEDKLKTSMLAQKSMEEIRSNPALLKSDSNLPYFKTYYESGTTKVKYKITQEILNVNEENEYNVEKLEKINFDIVMEIYQDNITVNENKFLFLNYPELLTCDLEIEDNAGVKSYVIKDSSNNICDSGNLIDAGLISIKVQFKDNSNSQFKLSVNADKFDNTDSENQGVGKVQFYIVDDVNLNLSLINRGYKKINVYNQITNSYKNYSNNIYKIEIVVEKDGSDINRLFSYVKKMEGE